MCIICVKCTYVIYYIDHGNSSRAGLLHHDLIAIYYYAVRRIPTTYIVHPHTHTDLCRRTGCRGNGAGVGEPCVQMSKSAVDFVPIDTITIVQYRKGFYVRVRSRVTLRKKRTRIKYNICNKKKKTTMCVLCSFYNGHNDLDIIYIYHAIRR